MYSIKNIGRVTGSLYLFIDILGLFSILYVPTDSAQAATVWLVTGSVLEGLVGRIEVLGGLWILLVTWGALRAGELPRTRNYLGLAVGAAGVTTAVPTLAVLGIIFFRVGEIVWNVWLGIVMLRGSRSAVARKLRAVFGVSEVLRGQAGRRLNSGVQTGQRGEPDVKP